MPTERARIGLKVRVRRLPWHSACGERGAREGSGSKARFVRGQSLRRLDLLETLEVFCF
ncbi:hypothetical protein ES332_D04G166800v1 [Gossypium tomentosum]|uniref:Uncharacterized protein n=1 Tax=Gossypium tomentosum TaxID=34277 RepID=A0A5D2LEQ3_GOSTO|nr:hypothetical protein ES332_D04G166800v1 [Gossypium tomentosum]